MEDLEGFSQLRHVMTTAASNAAVAHLPGEKAMIALVKMASSNQPEFKNSDLRSIIEKHQLCSSVSLPKEVSKAKTELLEVGFIQIAKKLSIFYVTDDGRKAAQVFAAKVHALLEENKVQEKLQKFQNMLSNSSELALNTTNRTKEVVPSSSQKKSPQSAVGAELPLFNKKTTA